ncbi:hypothetical protein F5146DRAFT_1151990 [Armillaria mellea]|nr:hypothetical protein F5146DRAFT_1151990 [Armillaria mellea]
MTAVYTAAVALGGIMATIFRVPMVVLALLATASVCLDIPAQPATMRADDFCAIPIFIIITTTPPSPSTTNTITLRLPGTFNLPGRTSPANTIQHYESRLHTCSTSPHSSPSSPSLRDDRISPAEAPPLQTDSDFYPGLPVPRHRFLLSQGYWETQRGLFFRSLGSTFARRRRDIPRNPKFHSVSKSTPTDGMQAMQVSRLAMTRNGFCGRASSGGAL